MNNEYPFPWFREHILPFNLRRTPSISCGILVVGSGIAGCSAALAAAQETDVILVTKGTLFDTNTSLAQGGIAAAIKEGDSPGKHMEDTLTTGDGLSEPDVVEDICGHAPEVIDILAKWGVTFDLNSKDELDLQKEGGHSHFRILHARGDRTGEAIQEVLAARVVSHPNITCMENCFILELMTEDKECRGALVSSADKGLMVLWAEKVILATGGASQVYRETTNPAVATGDGIALGFKAGAVVMDLEFVQFHPTALYVAGAGRFLISESVRGAGGILRDKYGNAFMKDIHPRGDLAPRDIVSRAVFEVMIKTQDTHVYLDMREIPGDPRKRFPMITDVCASFGIDIRKDLIPVRPAAHYFIGGLRVDKYGRTNIKNLYAVGEVSCTGFHGANRLASNSLLEGAWCGYQAGTASALEISGRTKPFSREVILDLKNASQPETELNVYDMIYSLKALMGRNVGIEREREGLTEALTRLSFWSRCLHDKPLTRPRTWELSNMLVVSTLLARSALWRMESRGVHYRLDHPERNDENYKVHTLLRKSDDGSMEVFSQPVKEKN